MLEIKAEDRDVFGKRLAPFREKGKLPAILYGPKESARPIFILLEEFRKIWQEAGESTTIQLDLGELKKEVLIQDVALDPVKNEPVHVDFYAARMDRPIQAQIPLVFEGVPPAVKDLGAILVKVMHEVEVEALPKNLPAEIIIDISSLASFDDKILTKDIMLPSGVQLVTNPEEVIALTEAPREEETAPAESKIAFEEIEISEKKGKEEKEESES